VAGHGRPDHLTRTAHEPRQELVADARIALVREETPTIRELTLEVKDPDFVFRAGNWVDFFIDGVSKVGGYSMCSTPAELPRLRLAVKRSKHPPAAWCHSEAAVAGATVQVKAGGQFSWDPIVDGPGVGHLLFLAGGIGINPLYSMLQAASAVAPSALPELRRISLLYSASKPSELAFRGHLEEMAGQDGRLRLDLRVTRNEEEPWIGATGRIDAEAIAAALAEAAAPTQEVLAYVCGPPAMTDSLTEVLTSELGLPADRVRFEKWW